MAAGDISDALVTRLRLELNETTAGFWQDTDLYNFLDYAQSFIIDARLLKVIEYQNRNKFYDDPILYPLITSSSVAWDTSANTITLPDYRLILYAELYKSATGATLQMTKLGYEDTLYRRTNSYVGHSTDEVAGTGQVFYYVGSKLYTSYPTGTHSSYYDKVTVYYVSNPSTISTSVDPALTKMCYEAMIQYALYLALTKYKAYDKAQVHLTNFLKWISI